MSTTHSRQLSPSDVREESPDLSQVLGLQIVSQLFLTGPHMAALLPGLQEVSGEQKSFEKEDFDPNVTLCPNCLGELELVVATGCIPQELGFQVVF